MGTAFNQDISHSSYGEVSHHGALPLGNPQIQYDAHGQTHYDAHPQQQLQNQYDFHQPHQQQQHYTYAQMPQQQVHYQHQPPPQHYSAYQQAAIAGNEYLQPLSGMSAPPNPLVGAGVAPSRSVDGFGHVSVVRIIA
ncbi:hypothetical protein HDU83_009930 [Entophlyctis luteolus]|nr:hypothetical protein HDU83_009930 [Entophlyctis luteolus]